MSITLYSNVKPKKVSENAMDSSQDVCEKQDIVSLSTFDSKFVLCFDEVCVCVDVVTRQLLYIRQFVANQRVTIKGHGVQ